MFNKHPGTSTGFAFFSHFFLVLALFTVFTLQAEAPSGEFDWNQAHSICPGIMLCEQTDNDPRPMKMWFVRIDLATPGLNVRVTGRAADREWGTPMPDCPRFAVRTKRASTVDFMRSARNDDHLDMRLAVNASPWVPWESPFNHIYADGMGLVISDGVLVSLPNDRPALVFDAAGNADMIAVSPNFTDCSRYTQAVGGFFFVLNNGKPPEGLENDQSLAPRTGFGLSADRRYWYIFLIDGRQPDYSMGCTPYEVGEWLRHLGADTAINMDGGGSSSLVIIDNNNLPAMLNHQPGGGIRRNGCNIGIYFSRTPDNHENAGQ
ncbi:MAG: phosphodiester glycosidase family protein [Victivallaceae bacterium]|nr:phosphodiester glycosidase family protein [Victivallaceae bacterium]